MKLRTIIITTMATALPIVYGVIFYNQLPARMAIHFGLSGQANGWSNKFSAVIGIPLLLAVFQLIMVLSMKFNLKQQSQSPKVTLIILWLIPLISNVISVVIISKALGQNFPILPVISVMLGVIFIGLGNYLPKTAPNYLIGFRIPTTFSNPENWQKTNRLGGLMMVMSGVLVTLAGIIGFWITSVPTIALIIAMVLIVIVPLIYSLKLASNAKN
ncbi:MAG: SdpI family protein [Lactobacillaceae bacterium]|jgi:uncharacterized membrane protein|nr:SdpI family protein [Lactobacillaceae bacterium]